MALEDAIQKRQPLERPPVDGDSHQSSLHADADLSKPDSARLVKVKDTPLSREIERKFGTEDNFVKTEHERLRDALTRTPRGDARERPDTARQVYEAIADNIKIGYETAVRQRNDYMQNDFLKTVGLTRSEFLADSKTNPVITDGYIRHERSQVAQVLLKQGLDPASASLEQLEEARARLTYRQMKTGTLPTDVD